MPRSLRQSVRGAAPADGFGREAALAAIAAVAAICRVARQRGHSLLELLPAYRYFYTYNK